MDNLSFISLGGVGDVTKNMYMYTFGRDILLVDCGIGFVDESMPGVDLAIPNITYLKQQLAAGKRIVGMMLTHGHEDHIGALPFILPQLPPFPVYGTTLTAALSNEKLAEFGGKTRVTTIGFNDNLKLGPFNISIARLTHSIMDTSNIFIRTPIGNFYHGSDFKIDLTPADGKPSELRKIAKWGEEGILCTMSDCLGAERPGHSRSELSITDSFDDEMRAAKGKVFITTYSSNLSRMNQAIEVAKKYNRRVCFIGRSFTKVRDVGRKLKYMDLPPKMEIRPQEVRRMNPANVLILLAGSQGQAESGLSRISEDQDRDIFIKKGDVVIFSADPIPGNEKNITDLIDTISKKDVRVVYSQLTDEFHVSGHGAQNDLKLLISLTNPKFVLPIGGNYKHMVAYERIAEQMGYTDDKVIFADEAKEIIFSQSGFRVGKSLAGENVYVDQVSRGEIDSFIVMDRKKIAEEGLVIIIAEISNTNGQLTSPIDIIVKGMTFNNKDKFMKMLTDEMSQVFAKRQEKVTNWGFYRKTIQQKAEQILYGMRQEPLIVPVVLEV